MGKWLSKAAVLWALDEAPDVPARLVSTLIAVARYTGTDGRGARAAASEIARCTRKSERQVQRDLAELEKLGLLRRGDPRLAAHIPANFRPNVYDIPFDTSPVSYQTWSLDTTPVTVGYDTQRRNGTSPTSYDQSLKSAGIPRASRARAESASAGALETRFRAPPCSSCGQPFTQEELTDPAQRRVAMTGDGICQACIQSGECNAGNHGQCAGTYGVPPFVGECCCPCHPEDAP